MPQSLGLQISIIPSPGQQLLIYRIILLMFRCIWSQREREREKESFPRKKMMMRLKMSLLPNLVVFLASFYFLFFNVSEAHRSTQKNPPSAVIVGTVYCDTCFHQDFSKSNHFISGATVAVECKESTNPTQNFHELVKTNENGEFKVHLPFSISKHMKKIKACSVKLISSNEPFCSVASTATSSSIHLKSRKEGTHIFSAGFFTFKPLKQPEVCDQKPSISITKKKDINGIKSSISDPNDPTFLPPISDPPSSSNLPNLPSLPPLPNLPNVPILPPLLPPGLPLTPPKPTKKSSLSNEKTAQKKSPNAAIDQFFPFPPIPFLPPPSVLPPNPLLPPPSVFPPILPSPPSSIFPPVFPSPPPSIFPPILPSPPSPPAFNLPPLIPGLTPSPPPPRTPSFPFPFQPIPGFPGVPPAVSATKKNNP